MSSISTTLTGACSCCGGTPTECACALLIPPFASPYADYATAAAAISAQTANCYGFIVTDEGGATGVTSFSSDVSVANQISLSCAVNHGAVFGNGQAMWASVTIGAGTITLDWNLTNMVAVQADIYDCNGTIVDGVFSLNATDTFTSTSLTAGTYYVKFYNTSGTASCTSDVTISATALVPNPVIALWDDSGTTRQLEACPKLLLPALTESSGTWYGSLTDAEFDLLHSVSTGCLGYTQTYPTTFNVSFSGGTFSIEVIGPNVNGFPNNGFFGYFSINAVVGKTLTFTYTVSPSLDYVLARIYDDTGNLIDTISASSPMTSSALPYTGRYTIYIEALAISGDTIDADIAITSDGTISANPVELLYHVGLSCPARLECDDTHTYTPSFGGGGGEA